MQLFIGGACAGKRDLVAARFPDAGWTRIDELGLDGREHDLRPGTVRVLTGWTRWLESALVTEPSPATEPTERSISAAEITKVTATAITAMIALWTTTFRRFVGLRKPAS